jgi:hypothetical protein
MCRLCFLGKWKRFGSEKQILGCAKDDRQKSKGKNKSKEVPLSGLVQV